MERNDQLFITRMMMRGKVTVVWRSASQWLFNDSFHLAVIELKQGICVDRLPKYLAPEVLCTPVRSESFHFDDDGCVCESFQDTSFIYASSPRSDVWSFGLILLEFLLVSSAVLLFEMICLFAHRYSVTSHVIKIIGLQYW